VFDDEPDEVENAEEGGDEPADGSDRRTRKSKRARRAEREEPEDKPRKSEKAQAGGGSPRVLLFAGGGLLLLVGAVVAGFVLSGGKPKETVQDKPELKDQDTPPPVAKPPVDGSRPKDKNPPPKEGPSAPVVTPPPPVEPAGPSGLTERWKIDLGAARAFDPPVCSSDGGTVVLRESAGKWAVSSYDLETGTGLGPLPGGAERSGPMVAMEGGLFTCRAIHVPTLTVWDPRAGKLTRTVLMTGLVLPGTAHISPTGKYVASSGTVDGTEVLRLKSTNPDKIILDLTWANGTVFFTDDEARVLVAEATGRCRWYKLPSGEADGEWTIEKKGPDLTPKYGVKAVSGNGSAVVYWGSLGEQPVGVYVMDGTGRLRGSIPHASPAPTVSRDGRFVLVHFPGNGKPDKATVLDIRLKKPLVEFQATAELPHFQPVLLPDGRGCAAIASSDARSVLMRYEFAPPKPAPDPGPGSPAPGDPPEVPLRWTVETPEFYPFVQFAARDRLVLGFVPYRDAAAYDKSTGEARRQLVRLLTSPPYLTPLTDGRVAKWTLRPNDFTIELWDDQSGELKGTFNVPDVPPRGDKEDQGSLGVSPNGRYAAFGWARNTVKAESDLPMRVFDLQTKKALLSHNWTGGHFYFTGDSSRVLVAEYNGKCRWYKLPSGEPDGQWDLGFQVDERHDVKSASDDGSVLTYLGPLGGKEELVAATLDGKTGAVLHRFGQSNAKLSPVVGPYNVSADGRRVLVFRRGAQGHGAYEVADTRTGAVAGRITPPKGSKVFYASLSRDGTAVVVSTPDPKPAIRLYEVPAAQSNPGAAALELKPRWSAETPEYFGYLYLPSAVKSVFSSSGFGKGAAFTLEAGAPIEQGGELLTGQVAALYPLNNGQVGRWEWVGPVRKPVIELRDERTGKLAGKLDVPNLPGRVVSLPVITVSRDARYVASGYDRQHANAESDLPLRVFDLRTNKEVLSRGWTGGRCFFTGDASRVLVAEYNGKGRWYKLPSGEPDGEWDLGFPAVKRHLVEYASDDGSVLTYLGPLERKAGEVAATLDGKTGAVLHRFPEDGFRHIKAVSADGRRVVVWRPQTGARGPIYEVADARTGAVVARVSLALRQVNHQTALSPDGMTLALTVQMPKPTVQVYDLPALDPLPGAAAGPAAAPSIPVRWTENKEGMRGEIYLDADGKTIAVATPGKPWSITAYDARTGAVGRNLPNIEGRFTRLFPLPGGNFAFQKDTDKEATLWQAIGATTVYPFTAPDGADTTLVNVSPSARYLVIGAPEHKPGSNKPFARTPLRVFDLTTQKDVVTTDWYVGTTVFTPDSSRLLVADDAGKFRWFRLPDGKPDGEWSFNWKPTGHNIRNVTVSADGGVIHFFNFQGQGAALTHTLLNGKTGAVLHLFPVNRYDNMFGCVSDDGKYVAQIGHAEVDPGRTIEVLDVRGKVLVSSKHPMDARSAPGAVRVNWKTRTLLIQENNQKVTVYDLPDTGGAAAAPKQPNVGAAWKPLRGLPAVEPVALTPARFDGDSTRVKLPAPASGGSCVGGGGRFLIFHQPSIKKLAVYDVCEARVVKTIPASEKALFAAGMNVLVIVDPEAGTIERWGLTKFTRERSVPLPTTQNLKAHTVVMGSASSGPLLVQASDVPRLGERFLFDVTAMKVWEGTRTSDGIVGALPKNRLWAAADGTTFTLLHESGRTSVLVITAAGPREYLVVWEARGALPLPSADGQTIYALGDFAGRSGRHTAPAAGRDHLYLPAAQGPLFLALKKPDKATESAGAVHAPRARQPLFALPPMPALAAVLDRTAVPAPDQHVFFVPAAHALVVLSPSKDALTQYKFDPEARFAKLDDYLFVASAPPAAVAGKRFEYQLVLKTKKPATGFKIGSGPDGLTVDDEGHVAWDVPANLNGPVTVVVAITDAAGKEFRHEFELIPTAESD
jgi:WD40 repeat protein